MTALNPNDSEYKSKIKQNLDIFFKEDKYVNHTIDNEIKKLIHHFNDFKKYIIIHLKKSIFYEITQNYESNIAYNNHLKYNEKFKRIHIDFDMALNENTELYENDKNEYRNYFNNSMQYYRLDDNFNYQITPFNNRYLIYSLQKELKETEEKFECKLIQMNEEITYSISNLKKETEEQINENLMILNNYVDKQDFKRLFECQKEINKEMHEIITLHSKNEIKTNNSIKNLKMILIFNIIFQLLFITFYYWSM